MFKINPYRPGAGLVPTYIAGRENIINDVDKAFEAISLNIPVQSIIFSGLRGVGKTVLINKLQQNAENYGCFCSHIEVEERRDFISQINSCCQMFLRKVSAIEAVKECFGKALDAIKSLSVSFDPDGNKFTLSLQEKELYTSTSLNQSLTEVFVSIGEIAMKTETPVCFFIDEIQYMRQEELGALITAIHRSNQLGYPVLLIGAGLPKIYKMLSDEKSYSERLFSYFDIGSLNYEQSKDAIVKPVERLGYYYTDEAMEKIVNITKGYPFFIQQLCKIIIDNIDTKKVEVADVEQCLNEYYETLDGGFFKVRYERCSASEKKFIFAMVDCDELPCTINNVAKNMGKEVNSISPARAQLINKGIIYPVRHKEIDFTVPEFNEFIKRLQEYQYYIKEK